MWSVSLAKARLRLTVVVVLDVEQWPMTADATAPSIMSAGEVTPGVGPTSSLRLTCTADMAGTCVHLLVCCIDTLCHMHDLRSHARTKPSCLSVCYACAIFVSVTSLHQLSHPVCCIRDDRQHIGDYTSCYIGWWKEGRLDGRQNGRQEDTLDGNVPVLAWQHAAA